LQVNLFTYTWEKVYLRRLKRASYLAAVDEAFAKHISGVAHLSGHVTERRKVDVRYGADGQTAVFRDITRIAHTLPVLTLP